MLRCYRFFCIEIRSDANFLPQAIVIAVVVVLYTKHFEIVLFFLLCNLRKGFHLKCSTCIEGGCCRQGVNLFCGQRKNEKKTKNTQIVQHTC